jgi:hypothetical protein
MEGVGCKLAAAWHGRARQTLHGAETCKGEVKEVGFVASAQVPHL